MNANTIFILAGVTSAISFPLAYPTPEATHLFSSSCCGFPTTKYLNPLPCRVADGCLTNCFTEGGCLRAEPICCNANICSDAVLVTPRLVETVVNVPIIQDFVQTLAAPIVENIHYQATPINCPCGATESYDCPCSNN